MDQLPVLASRVSKPQIPLKPLFFQHLHSRNMACGTISSLGSSGLPVVLYLRFSGAPSKGDFQNTFSILINDQSGKSRYQVFYLCRVDILACNNLYSLLKQPPMKTKQTFSENLKIILGRKYLLNLNSGEIHLLTHKTKHCWIHMMNPKNKVYMTEKEFKAAMTNGYKGKSVNGCRWCLKNFNKG